MPVGWLLLLSDAPASLVLSAGPAFTLGLMGVGILAAAIVGRFWVGVLLALINVACLVALALALDMPALPTPIATALVMIIASGSFAARGALFTKTLSSKAWLMGLFVVAGEASVLLIAALFPGVLPNWFLALLPAQWASVAIQTTVTGTAPFAAVPAVIALAGTASTTLLAARLWFRSWPYALMFNAWLGLSALVYFWPVPTAS
ncbi:MAG: hypothetical protein AAGA84_09765 [Pseudomonadota bacterium]